jgi:divalent metal cation (Fe/Co/Zn/Cd) transporter
MLSKPDIVWKSGIDMEFSRVIAHTCFVAGKWLMVATGTLFLLLAWAQHWRAEPNANPYLTIGTAIGSFLLALLLRHFAKRIARMDQA